MTKDEALDLALKALENNRRTHYYCEDTWYSCPKHEDGCANEAEGDECNCGADKANQEIDNAITAIKQARSAPTSAEYAMGYAEGFNDGCKPAPVQEDWGPGPHECHSLTASVQEPVAWRYRGIFHEFDPSDWAEGPVTPLYTTPPAAPVQEPVWIRPDELQKAQKAPFLCRVGPNKRDDFVPLYTTPPAAQRQWVGLTTEDMATCINEPAWDLVLRKADQILKEKNI